MCDYALKLMRHPDLTKADLAAFSAIVEYPEAKQTELAAIAGVSIQSVERAVQKLEAKGLIIVHRSYNPARKISRNTYELPQEAPLKDEGLPQEAPLKDEGLPQEAPLKDEGLPQNGAKNGQNGAKKAPLKNEGACMMHDDEYKNGEKIRSILSFIDEPNRSKIAQKPHCTLEYAETWLLWFNRRDYGNLDNPIGYLVTRMLAGDHPSQQIALPAGTLPVGNGDLVSEVQREFERRQSKDNARWAKQQGIAQKVVQEAEEDGRLDNWYDVLELSEDDIIATLANLMTSGMPATGY